MTNAAQPMSNMAKVAMLLTASIAIAVSHTHAHFLGAMVNPLKAAYGWSRGDVAFALTISTVIYPFTTIIAGMLADRYPIRWIVLSGICMFVMGTALLGLTGGPIWTWYAGYTLFSFTGAGISAVLFTKLIVTHFSKRRGLALAVALAGSGLLISFIPHIVLALHQSVGVKGVYPVLAVCAFVLLIIPCWLFLPRDQQPADRPMAEAAAAPAADAPKPWRNIVGSFLMWRMGLSFLLIGACSGIFIVHLQPMLTDAGLSPREAATTAIFLGPAMIAGRLGTGLLYDFLPARLVTVMAFSIPAFAYIWLLFFPITLGSVWALAAIIGLCLGSETDCVAYLCSRYFKTHQYGLVFSILVSLYGAGIGVASWLVGEAYDAVGSYDAVLLALLGAVAVAIGLILTLGPPNPRVEAH